MMTEVFKQKMKSLAVATRDLISEAKEIQAAIESNEGDVEEGQDTAPMLDIVSSATKDLVAAAEDFETQLAAE